MAQGTDIRRVGLIGLGKMGLPMARHLVKRGFTVAGFDVAEGAMEGAAEAGVQTALRRRRWRRRATSSSSWSASTRRSKP